MRLNPYIAIILTFVSTIVRSDNWLVFKWVIPWSELVIFFLNTVPRSIVTLSDEAAGHVAHILNDIAQYPLDLGQKVSDL